MNKSEWFAEFEKEILATVSKLSGKIDWDTATFYHNSQLAPSDAARRYVSIPR